VTPASITNVESIVFTSLGASTVDFDNVSGVTSITSTGSSATLTVDDIQALTTSITVANSAAAQSFVFKDTVLSGSTDSLILNLDGAAAVVNIGGETDTDGDIETLIVNATGGASDLGVGNGFGADATSITVNATAALDLGSTAQFLAVTSFDAAASTAAVTAVFATRASASETAVSITGGAGADNFDIGAFTLANYGDISVNMGAGNDTLDMGAAQDTDTGSSFNGGAGTDTLIISTTALVAAEFALISNFEVLNIETTGLTQDADFFTGTTFGTGAAIATMTISDLADDSVLNVSHNVTTLTGSLKTDTASDAVTVNIGGTAGAVTLGNLVLSTTYETVTVNSQGTSANVLSAITTNVINNMTFTGSTAITVSSTDNITGVVDFTNSTGDNTVTVTDTSAQTISFGAGDDTLTTGVVASSTQTINGGAGDDTITAGVITTAGVLVLNGEAGSDTISVAAMTGATTASSATINGGAGFDFITLDAVATNSVVVASTATAVADADKVTSFTTTVDDFDYNGTVLNDTASTITAVSDTTLAAGLAADADATVYIVSTALTGTAATTMASLVAATTVSGIATAYATFEAALVAQLGTITGLDSTLGASESVLVNFDDGTNSVILRVTNTDTSTANTLIGSELELVAIMVAADDLVVGDFI
jgi:hypothetical protein